MTSSVSALERLADHIRWSDLPDPAVLAAAQQHIETVLRRGFSLSDYLSAVADRHLFAAVLLEQRFRGRLTPDQSRDLCGRFSETAVRRLRAFMDSFSDPSVWDTPLEQPDARGRYMQRRHSDDPFLLSDAETALLGRFAETLAAAVLMDAGEDERYAPDTGRTDDGFPAFAACQAFFLLPEVERPLFAARRAAALLLGVPAPDPAVQAADLAATLLEWVYDTLPADRSNQVWFYFGREIPLHGTVPPRLASLFRKLVSDGQFRHCDLIVKTFPGFCLSEDPEDPLSAQQLIRMLFRTENDTFFRGLLCLQDLMDHRATSAEGERLWWDLVCREAARTDNARWRETSSWFEMDYVSTMIRIDPACAPGLLAGRAPLPAIRLLRKTNGIQQHAMTALLSAASPEILTYLDWLGDRNIFALRADEDRPPYYDNRIPLARVSSVIPSLLAAGLSRRDCLRVYFNTMLRCFYPLEHLLRALYGPGNAAAEPAPPVTADGYLSIRDDLAGFVLTGHPGRTEERSPRPEERRTLIGLDPVQCQSELIKLTPDWMRAGGQTMLMSWPEETRVPFVIALLSPGSLRPIGEPVGDPVLP